MLFALVNRHGDWEQRYIAQQTKKLFPLIELKTTSVSLELKTICSPKFPGSQDQNWGPRKDGVDLVFIPMTKFKFPRKPVLSRFGFIVLQNLRLGIQMPFNRNLGSFAS